MSLNPPSYVSDYAVSVDDVTGVATSTAPNRELLHAEKNDDGTYRYWVEPVS